MRVWLYIIFASVVMLSSCKKEAEPEVVVENPDFYLQGVIDGQETRIVAGDGGYYMYTDVDFTEDNVAIYTGDLRSSECASCAPGFKFDFRETQGSIGGGKVLSKSSLNFTQVNPTTKYLVHFNAEESYTSRAVDVDYSWDFGDGTTSTEPDPSHLFESDREYYDVCLTVTTSKGTSSKLCNRVYMQAHCVASFGLVRVGHQFELRANHKGGAPKLYHWQFGDRFSASTPTVDYNVYNSQAVETICLTITDEDGCTSQKCRNIVVYKDMAFTAANFSFSTEEVLPVNGLLQNQTVDFEYQDELGEIFRPVLQSNGSPFRLEILDVEEYDKDNNGNPVRRVHVILNAQLVSDKGTTKSIDNLEGYIGVAYIPE